MLLAVDTSTTRAGIALLDRDTGEVLAESIWQAGRDHGRHLMPAIQEMMSRLRKTPADLTAIVTARGPGSFTGLRVGLAVARGLSVALSIPAYGIGSLDVMANGLPPFRPAVRPVLAAGRGRFATARFRPTERGSVPAYIQDADVMGVTLETLLRLAVEPCAIVGDLDAEGRDRLRALGDHVWVAPPALSVRRPAVLAELGWHKLQQGVAPGPDEGEPIYLSREAQV